LNKCTGPVRRPRLVMPTAPAHAPAEGHELTWLVGWPKVRRLVVSVPMTRVPARTTIGPPPGRKLVDAVRHPADPVKNSPTQPSVRWTCGEPPRLTNVCGHSWNPDVACPLTGRLARAWLHLRGSRCGQRRSRCAARKPHHWRCRGRARGSHLAAIAPPNQELAARPSPAQAVRRMPLQTPGLLPGHGGRTRLRHLYVQTGHVNP
jgi:hypothetical protein